MDCWKASDGQALCLHSGHDGREFVDSCAKYFRVTCAEMRVGLGLSRVWRDLANHGVLLHEGNQQKEVGVSVAERGGDGQENWNRCHLKQGWPACGPRGEYLRPLVT